MNKIIAGIDEAGRGPLAGPVTVAACILDPQNPIVGLDDSKKLSSHKRELLYPQITRQAQCWKIIHIDQFTIDRINILQATLLGMQQAVAGLTICPEHILVDGNHCPDFGLPATAIIGGDGLEACISAASILAKVSRDKYMQKQHAKWPLYGFDCNKGYPTASHRAALEQYGPCPLHRRSFAPVRRSLKKFS